MSPQMLYHQEVPPTHGDREYTVMVPSTYLHPSDLPKFVETVEDHSQLDAWIAVAAEIAGPDFDDDPDEAAERSEMSTAIFAEYTASRDDI